MAKKRADGRYVRVLTIGHRANGTAIKRSVYGKSARDLEQKVRELHRQQDRGVSLETNKQTLEQYLREWLKQSVAIGDTSASTLEKYERDFTNHVYPIVGHVLFIKVNHMLLQDMMNQLRDKVSERTNTYLSARTLRNIKAALRFAFNNPAAKPHHPVNPAAGVKIPKSRKAKEFVPVTITPDMAGAILAAVAGHRYELVYRYMMTLGLREGEALGLHKTDLDMDSARLRISGALRRQGAGLIRGQTKTEASKTSLPIPPVLYNMTRRHLAQQPAVERASEYLFTTKRGTPIEPRNLIRHFKATIAALGLPAALRVQDCRRFTGTQLAQRVDPKTAQQTLRHTKLSTTMQFYVDSQPDSQRAALEDMESLLGEDRVLELPDRKVESE